MARKSASKREHVRVADHRAIEIDDRQRQTSALREPAKRAYVDEGRDPGRRAAEDLAFGDCQALAQLGQRLAPDHRRDQEAVALQRTPDLHQRARQIVDRLQREQRDSEIKPPVGDG